MNNILAKVFAAIVIAAPAFTLGLFVYVGLSYVLSVY
jgi:hypothetical protein